MKSLDLMLTNFPPAISYQVWYWWNWGKLDAEWRLCYEEKNPPTPEILSDVFSRRRIPKETEYRIFKRTTTVVTEEVSK